MQSEWKVEPSGWKAGPMPEDTYLWGGVVVKGEADKGGFYFADFRGDHVILPTDNNRRVEGKDILLYANDITLPPNS